jgi:cytosine/adenosine deaminase-related metal-dependent hydrolase
MIFRARWILPIDRPPIDRGWIEIANGRIVRLGDGDAPGPTEDLGQVVVLPGLVNAHTHLELSWMAGLVPPAGSMNDWIRTLLRARRAGPPGGGGAEQRAARDAAAVMAATGTVLVGDISNTLLSPRLLAEAGLGGLVFHELLGFNAADPPQIVTEALSRLADAESDVVGVPTPLRLTVAAHAPYSVAPALFREIANRSGAGPLTVHLGESSEEVEFLRTGLGPIRQTLEELGVWTESWQVPACDPVEYMQQLDYLRPGMIAVHGVHLRDDALARLEAAGGALVTCPRSNAWVGAGLPRIAHFYSARLPVAIGTDSLASCPSLSLFDELAELRRIAPDITAACLLESATRIGAEILGFGESFGTLAPGKTSALVAVRVPDGVRDVEEYLVGGVAAGDVRRVA